MVSTMYKKVAGFIAVAVAIVATSVAPSAYAVTSYNFASSSEETNALVTALAAQGLLIFLGAIAILLGIALIMLGAGWVWGRFQKFTGMKKKL